MAGQILREKYNDIIKAMNIMVDVYNANNVKRDSPLYSYETLPIGYEPPMIKLHVDLIHVPYNINY